ncbi:MAG: hypothetical protein AAF583_11805 [Pseudomonadota bacterium]
MKFIVGIVASALTLSACVLGDSLYDGEAVTQCDEIFDPARASECRLDQVESRQVRRSERRNERIGN